MLLSNRLVRNPGIDHDLVIAHGDPQERDHEHGDPQEHGHD